MWNYLNFLNLLFKKLASYFCFAADQIIYFYLPPSNSIKNQVPTGKHGYLEIFTYTPAPTLVQPSALLPSLSFTYHSFSTNPILHG